MDVIVCETSGDWGAVARRQLPPEISLVETRRVEEIWPLVQESRRALVVLEFNQEQAEATLAALTRLARHWPQVVPMVVSQAKFAPWEAAIREAGALHFIASPRKTAEIVEIARRMLSTAATEPSWNSSAGSETPQSLEDRILASLPWAG